MSYYYYLVTDYELEEKSLGIETLTMNEAINKGYKMPNFFNKKNFSEKELNEPNGAIFIDDRGSIEVVSIDKEEEYLLDIVKKEFVYEVIINYESDYVFTLLYEYITTQLVKGNPIEFWQLLNPKPKFVEGKVIKRKELSKDILKQFYQTDKNNDRLIII